MPKVLAALVLLVGLVTASTPVGSQSPVSTADAEVSSEDYAGQLAQLVPSPRALHPAVLGQVSLDLGPVGRLADDMLAAHEDLLTAAAEVDGATSRIEALELRESILTTKIGLATDRESIRRSARDDAEAVLAAFAVSTFVDIEDYSTYYFGGDRASTVTLSLANRSADVVEDVALAARDAHDGVVDELDALATDLATVRTDLAATDQALAEAIVARDDARERRDGLAPSFERALLSLKVPGTDIPVVVLDAYYRAQLSMAAQRPACGVTWWHLAGVGKSESSHGSFGGNVVGGDGRTSGEIVGPPLDGTRFSSIPDTDGGELDGDDVWDRAVGPMQFIPTSWLIYGSDGNGDGEVDPHNIYDAALAAAKHLCGTTSGLGEEGAFQVALLGYNQSVEYGLEVMGHAASYRALIPLV